MQLSESAVTRAGLLALAVALWRQAGNIIVAGLLPMHPPAVVLLLLLGTAGLALLVAASTPARAERWGWAPFAALALIFVAFAYRDAVYKSTSETTPTSDAHLYMDVAARYLLAGKNPYAQSLAEAFRIYKIPLSYSTPLLDGDFTDRVAYPAFSFLVLVPAVLLHLPTYTVFACVFLVGVALIVWRAPLWARPLVLAPLLIDDTFLNFAFGGITDAVWAVLLIGAVLLWDKRLRWSAVLVGLACAHKQHPWFVVPYLLIRLMQERREKPWQGETRVFIAIVAGVFIAINLPFFLMGPSAFIAGVTEPLRAPMVQLSEGLTTVSMTGLASMPRGTTSLFFWAVYGASLFIYARHTGTLRDAGWIFPALVLWFGYRALMSYWYLYAPIALAAMLTGPANFKDLAASWRLDGAIAGALAVSLVVFLVVCAYRPAPFAIELRAPFDAWSTQVFQLHVRVQNRMKTAVHPRFSVQARSLQPMQWTTTDGPLELQPGETGDFVLRAPRFFNEFGMIEGARVAVSADGDPAVRAFANVAPDGLSRRVDAIPNADFTFAETRTGLPASWAFDRSDGSVSLAIEPDLKEKARVRISFAEAAADVVPPPPLGICVPTAKIEPLREKAARFGYLSTTLALPDGDVSFDVNVPEGANVAPFDKLYGLAVAVSGFRGMVLFGAAGRGTLPSGEPYVGVAAPVGAWATVKVTLRDVLDQLGAKPVEQRHMYGQAPVVDVPTVPLEIGFFVAWPAGQAHRIEIGRITQRLASPEELFGKGTAAGLAGWRGELSFEHGNYARAAEYLETCDATEPTNDRRLLLADAYLLGKDFPRAVSAYDRARAANDSAKANRGLGFAKLGAGDAVGAISAFEHARDLYAGEEQARPRTGYLDSLRGLAEADAKAGRCADAMQAADAMHREDPSRPMPALAGCAP